MPFLPVAATLAAPFLAQGASQLFGGKGPNVQQEVEAQIRRRLGAISAFQKELQSVREKSAAAFSRLQQLSLERGTGIQEAKFAGRGLQVTGGGFQAELARAVTEAQTQEAVRSAEREREDLSLVEQLRQQAYGAGMSPSITASREDVSRGFESQASFGEAVAGGFSELFGPSEGAGTRLQDLLKKRRSRSIVPGSASSRIDLSPVPGSLPGVFGARV